jgi:carbon starvation protein
MHALPLMLVALLVLTIGYRFYSAFIAAKVLALDPAAPTPAHTMADGQNYVPTNRWILFGHHFAAITGAGPLLGPVFAAQFGYAPGLLWILIGVVLAGAVQDFIILVASVRRGGRSLAEIARAEIGPTAGVITAVAILLIIVAAISAMGFAVVNALAESPWGVFTIGLTIPVAMLMGVGLARLGHRGIIPVTAFGVAALIFGVIAGRWVAQSSFAHALTLERHTIVLLLCGYGFLASALPVWLLLTPRDYLSAFMKLGTIAVLVGGVLVVNPELHAPAFSRFGAGGGPIVPGRLVPFVFITIACGAISGFHALVGSGTTPKMIDRETHCRTIGYGAMLCEALVAVVALIAASSLHEGDYYAINVIPEKFARLGLSIVDLDHISVQVGEHLAGRTGGSVSLAVGMAVIFSGIRGLRGLVGYWYHFAIMFEALFVLTTVDAGTRIGRFVVQEFAGRAWKPFARTDWLPANLLATAVVVLAWGWFLYTGQVTTLWPLLGVSNQLVAAVALTVGTSVIINSGRARYAWVTLVPLAFVSAMTLWSGYLNIVDNYLPLARRPGKAAVGMMSTAVTGTLMVCAVIILADAARKWLRATRVREAPALG